jgi:hypothetical protein
MFPSIQMSVVDEHQRELRLEAERERLASAGAGRPRSSGYAASRSAAPWPARLGQALAGRLLRLVAIGR